MHIKQCICIFMSATLLYATLWCVYVCECVSVSVSIFVFVAARILSHIWHETMMPLSIGIAKCQIPRKKTNLHSKEKFAQSYYHNILP